MDRVLVQVRCALWVAAALAMVWLSRPVVAAEDCTCSVCDFDQDGDVDLNDFAHLQLCLSGYGIAQNDPGCQDAKLAGHAYVDQQDVAIFANCLGGEQKPYPGMDQPMVVISEFVASNSSGLADEDGDNSDWIELHVPCQPVVNLEGWFLTDDPANLQKWAFPAVMMARGDYLVVFASGKDRRVPGQPLHTNFQLNKDGEYLALVAPDGQRVVHAYAPKFPEQLTDVSYGLAELSVQPVVKGAQARYHVPTQDDAALEAAWTLPEFADNSWTTGPTGLGFSTLPSAFNVTMYRANISIGDLATAESVIANPGLQTSVVTAQVPMINFWNSGSEGHFVNNQPYPGMDLVTDIDLFVMLATGTVVIPYAGEWTFGVNSDDGFGLTLTQGNQVFSVSYPGLRGASDTMGIFNITSPGIYTVRLVEFENYGGSSCEFFAAPGYYEAFDANAFRLVGDMAGGGVALGGVGWDVQTDLGPAMRGVNSSLWVRLPFNVDDPSTFSDMTLRIRYVDGFAAYLNGQPVVRRNAPGTLAWNSAATAKRTEQQASITEEIDLAGYNSLLRAGPNVLAIQGLNDTVADGDFAIVPELILSDNSTVAQYFSKPTPGEPNAPGALGFVEPVVFDQQRGFRSDPFQLTLSCPTPGVTIYYTLDGSTPTQGSLIYTGPLTIDKTSVVRAAGFKNSWLPSASMTHTYLFVNDIIHQSPDGEAPGPNWPAPGYLVGQDINYGMDPQIVNDPRYSGLIDDALLAIPSVSIVTDIGNMFDPGSGIFTHAGNDGRAWERPCSLELINPNGQPGFQINAGVRIRGGYSRSGDNPKHGFRMFFRSEYGQKELNYPLFGSEGVSNFRKVDLRTDQNYSWSFGGDGNNTMVRDMFTRDTQGAMGEPYARGAYCHLYIDGQYWGIYDWDERAEADYAASYFGGEDTDYDVVKVSAGPYTIYATDGTIDAWYRLWQACQAGFADDAAYAKVQGLNPDWTRNPAYEVLADVDNTIDCALLTYWCGDLDGPISAFLGNNAPNNFYVIRNRDGQSGFKCFKHDCEHTFFNLYEDRTGPWPAGAGADQFQYSSPQYVSQALASNAEYRVRFGDHAQKMLFNGGALTPETAIPRWTKRVNQIQTAIIAESARWGDSKTEPPLNRDDNWWPAVNYVSGSYLPARNAILLDQLKADGLYPNVAAPLISSIGGQVASGTPLILSRPAGVTTGTIYYTTDGTDPRVRGGAVAPGAQVFSGNTTNVTLVPAGSVWRYLDNGSNQGTAWIATGFIDTSWAQGAAQLGYGDGDEVTTVSYGPDPNNKYATTYFRRSFTAPAGVTCTSLNFRMVCDDGAAVYLNGHTPVTTSTMPTTWDYSTYCSLVADENAWVNYTINPTFLNIGNNNCLAVEVHQGAPTSSDISFDLELTATLDSSQPIVIDHNMTVKARILDNGEWSALVEATFITQPVGLVINEFMADNATTIQDPDQPGQYPDWIEIYNPNPVAVSMAGMYLTDDFTAPTKFKIASGVSVPANGYLVFWADNDINQGNLHANFALSKGGERIRLTATDGTTVIDQIEFGAQTTDVSYGRSPNGSATWGQLAAPTPGFANSPLR